MSKLTAYTVEVYKADKRIKKDERFGRNRAGLRFVEVKDFAPVTKAFIASVVEDLNSQGFVARLFETYVTRKNMMSGKEYQERYDTPNYCSPSSESFWSM